jgi:tRNA pseudouridine38-40 synthase
VARRWRLDVAYDGTDLHGFAAQGDQDTVAGRLAQALERTCRLTAPPVLTCAGRTDAGVHALAQVVHVDLPDPLPPRRDGAELEAADLLRSLNRQLAPAVSVLRARGVAPSFDARRSATARRYRYLVDEGVAPDPLLARTAFHVEGPLDLRAMQGAALALIGSHDFRAFCRRVPGTSPEVPIVRDVHDAGWSLEARPDHVPGLGRLLRFDIQANAFCHQMVRSIVGELLAVGTGRHRIPDVVALLRAGSRSGAADPAPSRGLCLVGVDYPDEAAWSLGDRS